MRDRFFIVRSGRMRGFGHKFQHGTFQTHVRNKAFKLEGDEILDQVTQRSCRIPVVGDTRNLVAQSCERPALTGTHLSKG